MKKEKVLLGLSGGVDSAVACALLIEQGYDVSACFMRNWDALANNDYLGNPTINQSQCPQEKDYEDAKKVAEQLNIPFLRIDFIKEYWDNVFSYFINEYEKGRTPNPDIFCNKYIKFDAFKEFAYKNGFDKIAMGHYADKTTINNKEFLKKAKDTNKDQTYFLAQLNEEQIASCIFPLGNINKEEVRKIAHKYNFTSVQDKKDSTGVCFIGERNFKLFLQNYITAQKGDIVDYVTKTKIGEHQGVMFYTIGQRRGLGIGGIKDLPSQGWFVCKKDVKNNILYVTSGDENEFLLSNSCIVKNINLLVEIPADGKEVGVKFRYRQKDHKARMFLIDKDTIRVEYTFYKAVTAGQIAAFYDGDILIGSGIIENTYSNGEKLELN